MGRAGIVFYPILPSGMLNRLVISPDFREAIQLWEVGKRTLNLPEIVLQSPQEGIGVR